MMAALGVYLSAMRSSIRPVRHLLPERFWEVDLLRGIAILLMVVYHFVWDLQGLAGYDINVFTGFWHYWQQVTANLFIGLAGASMALRRQRMVARNGERRYSPFFWRGVVIFSWGVVISVVTYLFDPAHYVRFGVLHLIGFSILCAYPLLRFRWFNLFLGLLLLLIGRMTPLLGIQNPWLGWLGVNAVVRPAFDYFPFIPWFGILLIGVFFGNLFYREGQRAFPLPDLSRFAPVRWLALAGQNSLLIYLLHQPIMIAGLTLLGLVRLY